MAKPSRHHPGRLWVPILRFEYPGRFPSLRVPNPSGSSLMSCSVLLNEHRLYTKDISCKRKFCKKTAAALYERHSPAGWRSSAVIDRRYSSNRPTTRRKELLTNGIESDQIRS